MRHTEEDSRSGTEAQALSVAKRVASELTRDGAKAVFLTGSWARGDAHPESDLDIRAIGDGEPKKLHRDGGFLISVAWATREENLAMLADPAEVGSIVPGWRSAKILTDPHGIAAEFQRRAEDWEWGSIDEEADKHVAKEMTKLSEEIHTLYTDLDLGIDAAAAATRVAIVSELVPIMAVHLRLLYGSEKELWDSVASKMGETWSKLQARALAQADETFIQGCTAAFEIFVLAAQETQGLLDDEQGQVVKHAVGLAREAASPDPETKDI